MAKRSAPRRARRRKRRGDRAAAAARPEASPNGDAGDPAAPVPAGSSAARPSARQRREAARAATRFGDALPVGERPQPPWHPFPLSEILIFVGLVGIVIGASRKESGVPAIIAGVVAVLVGTLDFTIREHLSGYRSHATLLAAVPTALFHSAMAVLLLALGAPSPSWVIAPLVLDVPVFLFLFRRLQRRFREARHARILAAGR